jgi:tRNA threonylcarbamoyladenosine biosynthesis protein TsaB
MPILAFDSSVRAISAAIQIDGRTVARFEACDAGHAERLLPLIEATLAEAGIGFADLTRLAVTLGPGGFTGVRVGLSAARGFALATGLPTVAVSSLQVMAWEAAALVAETDQFIVAVPAGRGAVFVQAFAAVSAIPLGPARYLQPNLTPTDAADQTEFDRCVLVGPGGVELAAIMGARPCGPCVLPTLQPNAIHLAHRAADLTPLLELRPIYLRAADATPPSRSALPRAMA